VIRRIQIAVLALICLTAGRAPAAPGDMLPDAILYPGDRPGHILVADKAEQMLYLYSHDGQGRVRLERIMPCSTGEIKGDKMIQGDRKTPNGFYIFNEKLLPRELSPIYGALAYPTDYPNFWDRKMGRGGYGIWIHGINKPLADYDSNGCIELENADIARMEELIRLYDTPLITYETMTQAPVEQLEAEGRLLRDFLETWRRAWAGKDHAAYRRLYDPEFVNSDGRSFSGWMTHKENVARNYQTITVEIKDLKIYRHRDVLLAVFEQDYRGDQRFTSIGLKRLYLKKEDGAYKIIGEEFRPLPEPETRKWLTAAEKRRALETPPLTVAKAQTPAAGSEVPGTSEQARAVADQAGAAAGLQAEAARAEAEARAAQARAAAEVQAQAAQVQAAAEAQAQARAEAEAQAAQVQAAAEAQAQAQAEAEAEAQAAQARAEAEAEAQARAAAEAAGRDQARLEAETRALEAARIRAEARAAEEARIKQELTTLVRNWAAAWSRRDAGAYLAFYHPDFYFDDKDLDLAGFINYRRPLIEEASVIEVKVSNFDVRLDGETVRVIFRQDYRSDHYRDRGRKTLTLKRDAGLWKIVAETWKALR
jgi:murein L,D-transpeptidase YafK